MITRLAYTSPIRWLPMLLLASTLLANNAFAATKLKVFILAGQSNTMCCAWSSDLTPDLQKPQPNVKVYGIGGGGYVMGIDKTGEMAPIAPWPNVNGWGDLRPNIWAQACATCGVSSYLTLGRDLAAGLPNDSVAIIICCAAPTTLAVSWRPPSSGGTVGPEYGPTLINGVKNAITKLGSTYQVEIAGMCWIQGESDGQDLTMANAYKTNLTNLVNDVRKDFNVPRMPFVIGMIDTVADWPYAETVRTAQKDVAAAISNVGINDTKGFPKDGNIVTGIDNDPGDDPGHYNAFGHMILGTDFAASMLQLLRNPTPGNFVEPSNLVVTVPTNGQTKLTWRDNSATETGFTIERKTGSGAYAQIGTAAAGTTIFTTYTDNTVAASTMYTYRVKAVNASSSSTYSNEFSISPYGNGDGLKAEYYSDTAYKTLKITQVDQVVRWNGTTSPATGIAASSRFSVRWTGSIVPRYSEQYAFFVVSDMMGKVWINDSVVIDPLKYYYFQGQKGLQPTHSGQIRLLAGQKYSIKVEYYVNTGGPYQPMCILKWKSPSQATEIIPKSQLFQSFDPVIVIPRSRSSSLIDNRPGELRIDAKSIILNGTPPASIVISDAQGRLVRSVKNSGILNLRGTKSGIYFVTVRNALGKLVNQAMIKR